MIYEAEVTITSKDRENVRDNRCVSGEIESIKVRGDSVEEVAVKAASRLQLVIKEARDKKASE